jgi:hypothetical protein
MKRHSHGRYRRTTAQEGHGDMGKAEVEFPEPPFAIDDVVAHLRRAKAGAMPAASAAIMARSVSLAPRAGPHHRRARGCAVPLRLGPAEVTAANEDIFVAASLQSALPCSPRKCGWNCTTAIRRIATPRWTRK